MRKPIIAGNWKMNKTPSEAKELVTALIPLVKDAECDVVVCVPSADFAAVSQAIKGSKIKGFKVVTVMKHQSHINYS